LALQGLLLGRHDCPEDLVSGGFESYTGSKDFPNSIHILAGKESRCVYFANLVHLRRKGKMSALQKLKRERIDKAWKPLPFAVQNSFGEVLDRALRMFASSRKQTMVLHTDEKQEYRRALKERVRRALVPAGRAFVHSVTSSRKHGGPRNPLASVNIIERQLRHNLASYRRSTICQNRDSNQGMARLTAYLAYYNWVKRFKIDNFPRKHPSHGEAGGVDRERIACLFRDLYERRFFLSHLEDMVTGTHLDIWAGRLETPRKPPSRGAAARIPMYVFS
jgi:hypothetical protein